MTISLNRCNKTETVSALPALCVEATSPGSVPANKCGRHNLLPEEVMFSQALVIFVCKQINNMVEKRISGFPSNCMHRSEMIQGKLNKL